MMTQKFKRLLYIFANWEINLTQSFKEIDLLINKKQKINTLPSEED